MEGDGGDGGTCEAVPGMYTTPGVYCPGDKDDAGSTVTCGAGQHCCETAYMSATPSSCQAAGAACATGDVDWECLQPADCANFEGGGAVCCVVGATQMTVSGCDGGTWMEYSGFTGTKCMASCPSGGFTVCEQDSDCVSGDAGAHCNPSKSQGSDFGYCGP
jgi:hypothetical protein